MSWTAERIAALAPDAASAKSGRDLAVRRKWGLLGRAAGSDGGDVLWGECQGSGKDPYQTRIDTAEPAFRCSCPSRKFPCKHALGLFLLFDQSPDEFGRAEPPGWVAEWLAGRTARAQKRTEKEARAAEAPESEPAAPDPAAQARRAAERERRVAAGAAELALWMRDLLRQGLGGAPSRPASSWETMAAHLVDAQAPGAARLVRQLATIPASGDGWPDRLLERLARLELLLAGYARVDVLPPPLAADVRAQLGWTIAQETLAAGDAVRDRWYVVGRKVVEEDRLRVQRTWLWASGAARAALLLHFAPVGASRATPQPVDASFLPGSAFDGALAYFPSAYPLRAVVKERGAEVEASALTGYATIADACAAGADAIGATPWIERFPMLLREVTPVPAPPHWRVRDASRSWLPLSPHFVEPWRLLAVSGGAPVTLFAEWDYDTLLPLSVWGADGAFAFG